MIFTIVPVQRAAQLDDADTGEIAMLEAHLERAYIPPMSQLRPRSGRPPRWQAIG